MKRLLFATAVLAAFGVSAGAQINTSSEGSAASSSRASVGPFSAATAVSGKLQSDINVKKARVGDKVFLKTTNDVKQNGKVVIKKGATLAGQVTQVSQRSKANAASSVGVAFTELLQNGRTIPINAVIMSVTSASSSAQAGIGDDVFASGSTSASTSTRSSSGGLLGGVTNTVGGTVNSALGTAGELTSVGTRTVGSTATTLTGPLSGLSIANSTSASAGGSSTLSLPGRDLKIEQGSTFNLSVSSSTTVAKGP